MLYRHPCILKFISSWKKNGRIHLATEEVKPLASVIISLTPLQICVGLHSILKALVFLHDKVSTVWLKYRLLYKSYTMRQSKFLISLEGPILQSSLLLFCGYDVFVQQHINWYSSITVFFMYTRISKMTFL